ncbi:acyltransferase family protein [Saccharopolyspora sp. CA-218241]|uniref:acyltransferase family protein n=1 Tax=Saccharopolyspora sp. CA-218241 TaxID=3240027 RepID=UPI003D990F76
MAGEARDPGLDGLRGAAVLLVVLFHLQVLEFGWLGVSLFFVISGHLITRTLMARRELRPLVRLRDFARNRALRLAPLYLLCCGLVTAAALISGDPRIQDDLLALWTWTFNLRPLDPGFTPNTFDVYDPMWSIGAESQIYLLWAVAALLPRRQFQRLVLGLICLGPLARVALAGASSGAGVRSEFLLLAVFSSPVTYLDAFAWGACTAFPELRARWARYAPLVLAMSGIVLAGTVVHAAWLTGRLPPDLALPVLLADRGGWVWQYSVVAALFAAAAFHAVRGGRFQRVLANRLLVRAGVLSYSVYLLHTPIVWLFVDVWSGGSEAPWSAVGIIAAVGALVVIAVVAELAHRFVEVPFFRWKRRPLTDAAG